MLDEKNCCLVIIDVQGKLAQIMYNSEVLFKNIQILIKAAKILSIPIIWCQQIPKALGVTVPQIANLLTDNEPVNKSCFSCCGSKEFKENISSLGRSQVLLCGIEAHVCVYLTSIDLIADSKEVHIIADAVSSRTSENRQIALERMLAEGAKISSTEMAIFEILKSAEHPQFKQIIQLVK